MSRVSVGDADGNLADLVKISGSNTRKRVSDTILFGGATVGAHHAGDIISIAAGEILEFDTGLPAGGSVLS